MRALCFLAQAHGCDTPGKCSPDKMFYEWKWSREFTRMLANELNNIGVDTIIINPSDREMKLVQQADKVNELIINNKGKYDKFFLLSPHVNAGPENKFTKASGFCAFVGTKASENSKTLAKLLEMNAIEMNLTGDRWIPNEKYYTKALTICNRTNCPAVLTENMFMTNRDDVVFLESENGKKKLLDLHRNAVKKYLDI